MLGSFGGTSTVASALNNLGQVAGSSKNEADETYAFLWDAESGLRNLGSLDGIHSEGFGINDFGQVCGLAFDAAWTQHAVVWNPDSSATVLDSPAGWVDARDLNESGDIVGHVGTRPVRWAGNGPPVDLGHVIELGSVHAINSAGSACGASDLPGSGAYLEAGVWEPDGSFRPLGAWTDAGSDALDVNDLEEVVGWAGLIPYGPTAAIHWSAAGAMTDLNSFAPEGWLLLEARGINARGDIVGLGRDPDGVQQAFVLWNEDPATVDYGPDLDPQRTLLRIAPTPGPGPFMIRLDAPYRPGDRFRVFDILGRQVDGFAAPSGGTLIWDPSRSSAADGVYLILLQRGSRILARGRALLQRR